MTAPVTPTGTPIPMPVAGKAKGQKGGGAQNEPGFASLLAAMATPPGQAQTALPILPLGEGQEQPGAMPAGAQAGHGLPAGAQAAWTIAQNTPAALNAQVPEGATAPPFHQALAGAAANMVEVTEGAEPTGQFPLPDDQASVPGQAAQPATGAQPGDLPEVVPGNTTPLPVEGEEQAGPVETAPPDEGSEGRSETPGHQRNPRANDPALTRGLERAAQVSRALENRPADAPNADKFPLANRVDTQPGQPVEPTPAGAEGPVAPVTEAGPEIAEPRLPVEGQPAQPPAADPAQADAPVEQARPQNPLSQLTSTRFEPRQMIDQLVRAIQTLDDGQYSVTLRLHPEQLGEVRLQLHMSGREVHAAMEVMSQDARQLLENRSDQLRQSLSQAGLTLSGFEVNTGQHRQSLRDRQNALAEAMGGSRRPQQVEVPAKAAVNRIRGTDRRGGRLDTMA
ncbi:MAG: flagellar hook-length control protein FliK [Bacillota bacterium]